MSSNRSFNNRSVLSAQAKKAVGNTEPPKIHCGMVMHGCGEKKCICKCIGCTDSRARGV